MVAVVAAALFRHLTGLRVEEVSHPTLAIQRLHSRIVRTAALCDSNAQLLRWHIAHEFHEQCLALFYPAESSRLSGKQQSYDVKLESNGESKERQFITE